MELARLGEPLLKSRASPLLSFLAPSVPPTWWLPTAHHRKQTFSYKSSKPTRSAFHSTVRKGEASSATEAAAFTKADLDYLDEPDDVASQQVARRDSRRKDNNARVDHLLGSVLEKSPDVSKAQSHSTRYVPSDRLIEDGFRNTIRNNQQRQPGSIFRQMITPGKESTTTTSAFSLADSYRGKLRANRTIRSSPTLGRTVELNPHRGVDFGRALTKLNILCAVNRVRNDAARQRFHERPGAKRKRLASERFRKLFKESFTATVRRVKELRRKGW
ncbi:hypothetical protein MMC21_005639 [Puttea exsequens]|nr:hypothetical protein [Puttea exsequens]